MIRTSAVDTVTDAKIRKAFAEKKFLILQKLLLPREFPVLRTADRIIVFG